MKRKDIFLDFTSLLDVTLILLFFFVMFSHFDSVSSNKKVKEAEQAAKVRIEEAALREEEADRLSQKLENELKIVTEASERNGSNVSELLAYNRDRNLKILMDEEDGGYSLRIITEGEVKSVLSVKEGMSGELKSVIAETGYDTDDTILCEYIFDGSAAGSRQAYIAVTEGLGLLSEEYRYLYISETDLSKREEN